MGWLYKQSLEGHSTPTEYLDHQFTFTGELCSYRVLRSALVQMKRYYAAVERVTKATGEHSVFALICLVDYNPRAKDHMIFGYKDMDETAGADACDCPGAILDLLTATDSAYALDWRSTCRERLAARSISAASPKPVARQSFLFP